MLKKQRLVLALQSKITLLQRRSNEAQENKHFVNVVELDIQIKTYSDILSCVLGGQFDA